MKLHKAYQREAAAYAAVMAAPVTGPADILAKLRVRFRDLKDAEDCCSGDEEDNLWVALWRDLETLAAAPA